MTRALPEDCKPHWRSADGLLVRLPMVVRCKACAGLPDVVRVAEPQHVEGQRVVVPFKELVG